METPLPMATGWRDHHNFGEATDTGETYDLVVVGGGLGGLTAAYFYNRETAEDKKILILDNHPDFGGDLQCNELTVPANNIISTNILRFLVFYDRSSGVRY